MQEVTLEAQCGKKGEGTQYLLFSLLTFLLSAKLFLTLSSML